MNPLVIWKKDTYKIVYLNKKYSLYDNEKIIASEYDSLMPCADNFFIVCKKDNQSYKYQLLNINGTKVFGDNKMFEFITFNDNLNKFTFYDYFNKIELIFPKFSNEKNELFFLFLKQIYNKKINNILEFQDIVNKISIKIDSFTNEDIEKIINNFELINQLYIKLNKPLYLKNYLIVVDGDGENEILNVIDNNKNNIFKELTKDIIKNEKIYELNQDIINNIFLSKQIKSLNQILVVLNNIHDEIEKQMKYYQTSRNEIFTSLESIKNYYESKESIKYFDENDFNYIRKNKNLFLNIMFNNNNTDVLNLLKHYDIS